MEAALPLPLPLPLPPPLPAGGSPGGPRKPGGELITGALLPSARVVSAATRRRNSAPVTPLEGGAAGTPACSFARNSAPALPDMLAGAAPAQPLSEIQIRACVRCLAFFLFRSGRTFFWGNFYAQDFYEKGKWLAHCNLLKRNYKCTLLARQSAQCSALSSLHTALPWSAAAG